MMKSFIILSVFLSLACGWTFVPVSSNHLVSSSNVAVFGVVTSVGNSANPNGVWTDYQINVTRWMKSGRFAQSSVITVSLPGGLEQSTGLTLVVSGTPNLAIGDQGIFFLAQGAGLGSSINFQLQEFAQGFFRVIEVEGRTIAYRPYELVKDVFGLVPVRDAFSFINWIAATASGINILPELPLISISADLIANLNIRLKRFTTMTDGTNPVRWSAFDTAPASVKWLRSSTGQSGISGGGFAETIQAFNAWNANANTPINYYLNGTTTSTSGLSSSDRVQSVLYNDPANYIAGSFDCSRGGTLAVGGYWYGSAFKTFRSINFRVIVEGDLIIQDGISCYVNSASNPSATFANILAHEIGHTLGLGHSCGDSTSGACTANSAQDNAVMRAYVHTNGGATLQPDDKAGIEYIYSTCYPSCP